MQPSQQPNTLGYVSLILGLLSLALVCLFALVGLVEFIDSVTGIPPHGLLPVNRAYARQVIWVGGDLTPRPPFPLREGGSCSVPLGPLSLKVKWEKTPLPETGRGRGRG